MVGLLFLLIARPLEGPDAGVKETNGTKAPPKSWRDPEAGGFAAADDLMAGAGSPSWPGSGVVAEGAIRAEEPDQELLPWELSINKLLDSDDENNKVAAELALILPTLPLEGQVEAVQHMVNLTEDDKYIVASNMLLNPGTHPELREVLLADVLDRPNSVKLPVLLAVMAVPGHPSLAEAHRSLREVLGSDFGISSAAWSAPVQSFLAREADEEAKAEAEAEAQDQKTN